MDRSEIIRKNLSDSIHLKKEILSNEEMLSNIESCVNVIIKAYNNERKVLFCGNGGSAADAQHLSSELSGKYYFDRPPLNAEALHVNTSFITAVANDYAFDDVYSRMVQAIGKPGDILVGLSTSGNSNNVVNAMTEAKKKGMITIGLTGEGGGKMNPHCDILIAVPSANTPRIQECHMIIGHSICELVEAELF